MQKEGFFKVEEKEMERIHESGLLAGTTAHQDRIRAIQSMHASYGIVIDPHTADGIASGLRLAIPDMPLICLETAQPA